MLGTNYPDTKKFTTKNILATLSGTLRDADLTIGNLEGVLASDTLESKKCKDKKNCYAFRSPVHFTSFFKDAGFDFLSLANNHSGDFGDEGLRQTMRALDNEGIKYAGLKKICEYAILEKKQVKIGIIGVGHGGRHVHINNYKEIESLIRAVKQKADLAFVFFHGGAEGDTALHVTRQKEMFFTENRGNVYEMAHKCIDAGADMVIGSGPHVARAVELYKNKLIAYSLGNFATYGKVSLRGPMGLAPVLKVHLAKNGDFLNGQIISTKQIALDPSTPKIDTNQNVVKIMRELTETDFPETNIRILPDGAIKIKNF